MTISWVDRGSSRGRFIGLAGVRPEDGFFVGLLIFLQKKNGPSGEGPICLGSLWLGESVAGALYVTAASCYLKIASREKSVLFCTVFSFFFPFWSYWFPSTWLVPVAARGAPEAEVDAMVARLLCIRLTITPLVRGFSPSTGF